LLTAIGLTPGGSSTVHIYTQTIHRTTQLTTLVERLSGIPTQSNQTEIKDELFEGSHPDVSRNYQNRAVSIKLNLIFSLLLDWLQVSTLKGHYQAFFINK
jgi:hypothetical protein